MMVIRAVDHDGGSPLVESGKRVIMPVEVGAHFKLDSEVCCFDGLEISREGRSLLRLFNERGCLWLIINASDAKPNPRSAKLGYVFSQGKIIDVRPKYNPCF